MPAKTQSDLGEAERHVEEAKKLVGRGSDHVQLALLHLAHALGDLIKQLNG